MAKRKQSSPINAADEETLYGIENKAKQELVYLRESSWFEWRHCTDEKGDKIWYATEAKRNTAMRGMAKRFKNTFEFWGIQITQKKD